jgi:hypothetical protein
MCEPKRVQRQLTWPAEVRCRFARPREEGGRMAVPTEATDNVAHAAVALVVAIIVPMLTRKGHSRSILSGIAGSVMHMMLDGPLAQAMADHGLQVRSRR